MSICTRKRHVCKLILSAAAFLFAAFDASASTISYYEYRGTPTFCGGAVRSTSFPNSDGTYTPISCSDWTMFINLWLREDKTPDRIVFGFSSPMLPYPNGGEFWQGIGRTATTSDDHITYSTDPATGQTVVSLKEYRDYWYCRDGRTGPAGPGFPGEEAGCTPSMPSSYGLNWWFQDVDHWSAWDGLHPLEVNVTYPKERWGSVPTTTSMGLDNYWWGAGNLTRVPEPGTLSLSLPLFGWLTWRFASLTRRTRTQPRSCPAGNWDVKAGRPPFHLGRAIKRVAVAIIAALLAATASAEAPSGATYIGQSNDGKTKIYIFKDTINYVKWAQSSEFDVSAVLVMDDRDSQVVHMQRQNVYVGGCTDRTEPAIVFALEGHRTKPRPWSWSGNTVLDGIGRAVCKAGSEKAKEDTENEAKTSPAAQNKPAF